MKTLEKLQQAKEFFKAQKFIIEDEKLKAILSAIDNKKTIFATGPTGSGKTEFFMKLAQFLGGEYFYQSLNGSVCIQDLTQERVITEKGTFEAKDMILAEWLRSSKKGLSFLQLDEVNAAKPETLLALHPIMDIKSELKLIHTKEELKVNDNCILVMTMNIGDEYYGTNSMNAAFINRQGIKIHFNYLQDKELVNMLVSKTGVEKGKVEQVVNTWEKYMTSRDPEQPIVSIRILENWLEMSKDLGLRTAGKFTFAGIIANDEDELIEIIEGDFFVNLKE